MIQLKKIQTIHLTWVLHVWAIARKIQNTIGKSGKICLWVRHFSLWYIFFYESLFFFFSSHNLLRVFYWVNWLWLSNAYFLWQCPHKRTCWTMGSRNYTRDSSAIEKVSEKKCQFFFWPCPSSETSATALTLSGPRPFP